MSDLQTAFASYYKAERNRAEECLGDIIKIFEDEPEPDQVDLILERLMTYYQRS